MLLIRDFHSLNSNVISNQFHCLYCAIHVFFLNIVPNVRITSIHKYHGILLFSIAVCVFVLTQHSESSNVKGICSHGCLP